MFDSGTTYLKFYPNAGSPGTGNRNGSEKLVWSTHVAVLPFNEQAARYEAVRRVTSDSYGGKATVAAYQGTGPDGFIRSNEGGLDAHWKDGSQSALDLHAATGGIISIYICPSDPNARSFGRNGTARTNIMTSRGDSMNANQWASEEAGDGWKCSKRGAFAPHTWNEFSAIQDGLSNTLAAAEGVTAPTTTDVEMSSGGNHVVKGGAYLSGGTPLNAVNTARSPGDRNLLNNFSTGTRVRTWRGQWYASGNVSITGFCTVIRPNDISYGQDGTNTWGVYTAQSYHPGGVSALNCDGSVKFIPDTIDNGNLVYPGTSTPVANGGFPAPYSKNLDDFGASPFGVWGAAGTIGGGESTSL
jgi:hypothetical protein